MKLITESLDVEFLLEEANGKKSYYIEGPFIQMEVKNRNGRAYPKAHIYEEVCRYVTEKIDQRNSFGELGHPSGPTINLDRASHMIVSLKEQGNDWIGKAKLIDTPMGRIAKTLLDEGAKLGVSSRGLGTVKGGIVQNDFKLATPADIVADPSAPAAFVQGIMESKEFWYDVATGSWAERSVERLYEDIKTMTVQEIEEQKFALFEGYLNDLARDK
jgi:hypothetical protein